MEIFKKPGTKERLFEMMERVNKVRLNEDVNEVVSKQDTKVEHDPETGSYTHRRTYTHPNKQWEDFRKKITHVLSQSNQSIPRIEHFLHSVELKDQEEAFMQGYESLTDDASFKKKAVDDFYNWFEPTRGEFNEEADIEGSGEIPAYDEDFSDQPAIEQPSDCDCNQDVAVQVPQDENPPLEDMSSVENGEDDAVALLDPSVHWIDDYVPKGFPVEDESEVMDEANIDYPQVPDDAEAFEDRYNDEQEFLQQINQENVGEVKFNYNNKGTWVPEGHEQSGIGIKVVEQPMGSGNEKFLVVKLDSDGGLDHIIETKDSWEEATEAVKSNI